MKNLCVGSLPGRKRPCLYVQANGAIWVLAYFRSEEAMDEFLAFNATYKAIDEASSLSQEGEAGM
jgi:hypothetical protein